MVEIISLGSLYLNRRPTSLGAKYNGAGFSVWDTIPEKSIYLGICILSHLLCRFQHRRHWRHCGAGKVAQIPSIGWTAQNT